MADKYDIERKLGEGGFGAAYLCRAKDTGARYVMKRVHCESQDEATEGLKEMVLLKVLKDPFVVHCVDFFTEKLDVFIVMEFAEGGDLNGKMDQARRRNTQIEEKTILRWLCEISLGVQSIHKQNILHRDLKPANIFLTKWDSCKIGDFGISKLMEKKTDVQHTAIGTMGFLAPEVIEGASYGSKADIYSLGCILYEVCHLRSAYSDMVQRRFPQPLPAEYSIELNDLQRKMVEQEPTQRPTVDDILATPILQEILKEVRRESLVHLEVQRKDDEIRMLKLKLEMASPDASVLSIQRAATMSKAERDIALRALAERGKDTSQSMAALNAQLDDADTTTSESTQPSIAKSWNRTIKRVLIESPMSLLLPLLTSVQSIVEHRKKDEGQMMVKTRWLMAIALFLPSLLITGFTMFGVILHVLSSYIAIVILATLGLIAVALFGSRIRTRRSQIAFLALIPGLLSICLSIGLSGVDQLLKIAVMVASITPSYCASALNESNDGGMHVPTPLERISLSAVCVAVCTVLFGDLNSALLALCQSIAAVGVNVMLGNSHMLNSIVQLSSVVSNALKLKDVKWATMSATLIGGEVVCLSLLVSIINLSLSPLLYGLIVAVGVVLVVLVTLICATDKLGVMAYRIGFGVAVFGLWGVIGGSLSIGWNSIKT